MNKSVGEMFILGFRGAEIPLWLKEFSAQYGLGGVLLFDYDCLDKKYERNIFNPEQVKKLCAEIHALPSKPLIFIDQEGGKVRRLKEKYGFAPLASAKNFNADLLQNSFSEMKSIGIDVNLAPVIDIDYNPQNPDIGAVERSFSADPKTVASAARAYARVAKEVGLDLCLKHFPGMGAADKNAHNDLTDISNDITEEQMELFKTLAKEIPGKMILLSHGIVRQWEGIPVSMSSVAIKKIRSWDKEIITISDDMQMQGLQKVMTTLDGCVKAATAGLDLICIGNNLMDEQLQCASFADAILDASERDDDVKNNIQVSIGKIQNLKAKF